MTGSESLTVMNPVAVKAPLFVAAAPRSAGLADKTVGLVWNGKPGGDVALAVVAEHLQKRFPSVRFWRSNWESYPFTDEQLDQIERNCDVAVGTTGD